MLYIKIPNTLGFSQREIQTPEGNILAHDFLVYHSNEGSSFEFDLQALVKDCLQHKDPSLKSINFCPLYCLKERPKNLSLYTDTYIYLQNAEELYYIQAGNQLIQEKLHDYQPINTGLAQLKREESPLGPCYRLKSGEVELWIRSQGGKIPLTRADLTVYLRERDIKEQAGQFLLYEPNRNGKFATEKECKLTEAKDIKKTAALPKVPTGLRWFHVAYREGIIDQEQYDEAKADSDEQRDNRRHYGDSPLPT